MKRIALVVGTVGLGVFLVAGVALAMTITGTSDPNNITATNKADNIAASANRDVVNAKGGPDRIFGDGGNDTLDGGAGRDHIEGGDGDNVARGNDGDGDWVSVVDNDTNDFVSGGDGTEDVYSGPGQRRARRLQRYLREGLPDCIDTAGVTEELSPRLKSCAHRVCSQRVGPLSSRDPDPSSCSFPPQSALATSQ
jgi:Ca2+-binding RTX toxin-like protein